MHYCGVFPLGVQNICFVQSKKGHFTFIKSIKNYTKNSSARGNRAEGIFFKRIIGGIFLLQNIICYFSIKENKKKVEPSTLKNYQCQKITNSTLMSECWLSLTPQHFNFAF